MNNEIISQADTPYGEVKVIKESVDSYAVYVDNVCKHPSCTADDALRALASYMISLAFKIETLEDRIYTLEIGRG